VVVDGDKQAPARAMLRAVGFEDADFGKPQIGVASTWGNVTPCNAHIGELAREACSGIDTAGGKSVLFNTITVSDGISMGTPGMRYSLVSRELIADSVETVVGAAGFSRELADVSVAGGDVPPGRGDTDLRLAEVRILKAHRAQHGARRRLFVTVHHHP